MHPLQRISRHLLFWIVYCTYFYLQSVNPATYNEIFEGNTYKYAFISLCCFVPFCIFSAYLFLYFLLPVVLLKKRYVLFCVAFALVFAMGAAVNYVVADIYLYYVHLTKPVTPAMLNNNGLSYCNTTWALTIACIALGIKLTKGWYLQQQENLIMEGQKTRAELQLQKGRIHPAFLFRSLDKLQAATTTGSEQSSAIVLKLADLLSYSLYESDAEWVTLENEINCLKDLIFLEQTSGDASINLEVHVTREAEEKYIAPMVIVSFLQDSFGQLAAFKTTAARIRLAIIAEKNRVHMRLHLYKFQRAGDSQDGMNAIRQAMKRVDTIYRGGNYQIKLVEKDEGLIVFLNLPLINPAQRTIVKPYVNNTVTYAHA